MDWADVWRSEWIQAASIITVVVTLNTVWQLPLKYHPLMFIRLLAQRLGQKVNHPSRGKSQNMIAGSLGFLCLVLPLIIILALSLQFVHFDWFFDGIILMLAIATGNHPKLYLRVYKYLGKQNKILARECLSSLVLRKTEQLTPMGCAKAAMESTALRFYYQFSSVIFWFFMVGPVFALLIRLINDFHREWHERLPQFRYFGTPLAILNVIFQWLPCRLHSFIFSLLYRPMSTLKHWFRQCGGNQRDLIVACTAYSVQCELGGPAMYNNGKIRYPRHCQSSEVKLAHMPKLRSYFGVLTIALVFLYWLIAIGIYITEIQLV